MMEASESETKENGTEIETTCKDNRAPSEKKKIDCLSDSRQEDSSTDENRMECKENVEEISSNNMKSSRSSTPISCTNNKKCSGPNIENNELCGKRKRELIQVVKLEPPVTSEWNGSEPDISEEDRRPSETPERVSSAAELKAESPFSSAQILQAAGLPYLHLLPPGLRLNGMLHCSLVPFTHHVYIYRHFQSG